MRAIKKNVLVTPCCLVTDTAINASDFTISGPEDENMRLFDSSRNRKMEFLPIFINKRFPILVTYLADRCIIREISKDNFEHLFYLKVLNSLLLKGVEFDW